MRKLTITLLLTLLPVLAAGQGTISPSPYMTVLDANGNPVSGARIYTYVAGTTTPLTTYTTSALTVANANPIVADSAGRYVCFLSPGTSVKFVITTAAGAAIKTVDGVQPIPAASGNLDVLGTAGEALSAGNMVYLSAGDGGRVAGTWYKTNASNPYSSTTATVIGAVPNAIAAGVVGTIRIGGVVWLSGSLVVGSTYYLSATTAGAIATTVTTNNRRSVGQAATTTSLVLTVSQPVADWTAYTPTWTASGGGNVLNNGVISGRYLKAGKQVFYQITLTFGAGTVPGVGTYTFSLPSTAAFAVGTANMIVSNVGVRSYYCMGYLVSTTTVGGVDPLTGTSMGEGSPFAFGATDEIIIEGWYIEP